MIGKPKPGRYRLHGLDSPEVRPCSSRQGLPAPTWTAPSPSLSAPRASASGPSSASTTTRCSARRARAGAQTCPTPAPNRLSPALAQGPGTPRVRAPGQHRTVPRGRHPAGLINPHTPPAPRGHSSRRRVPSSPGADRSRAICISGHRSAAGQSSPTTIGQWSEGVCRSSPSRRRRTRVS